MMKKKILSAGLCLTMAVSLAGCSSGTATEPTTTAASSQAAETTSAAATTAAETTAAAGSRDHFCP